MDIREGVLYIVATPIGNLKDITIRAIEILREVDYILAEDTRTALKLTNHYNISKHIESYFVGNEIKKLNKVLNDIENGKKIALISENGTPAISDPGNKLVLEAHKRGLPVSPIPGPSALIAALSVSGIANYISTFIGFLPRSNKGINKIFKKIHNYDGNIIFYESPYRVKKLLERIRSEFGNVKIFLFKELTKYFETIIIDNIDNVLNNFADNKLKGEYVIIFNKDIK